MPAARWWEFEDGDVDFGSLGGGPHDLALEPGRSFVVHEEEIPTGGVRVERRWQLARGPTGEVLAWVGRQKSPGGGPMARTPLHFDDLTGWVARP